MTPINESASLELQRADDGLRREIRLCCQRFIRSCTYAISRARPAPNEPIAMSLRPYRDIDRRKSRQIRVGNVLVGGGAPISVQTMTNTLTSDAKATIAQVQDRKSTRLNSSH